MIGNVKRNLSLELPPRQEGSDEDVEMSWRHYRSDLSQQ